MTGLPQRQVDKAGDGCWLWKGVTSNGYGQVSRGGRVVRAHRAAYEAEYGPIPPGMDVLHRCDVPNCVRPDHLWLGTNAENVADKMAKGRHRSPCGERHGSSKLTDDLVREIFRLLVSTNKTAIGRRFGVSRQCISLIAARKTWRHVQMEVSNAD